MNTSSKRNVLLIVLPYLLQVDSSKSYKKLRSFLAFPYGVLSMATYLKSQTGDKINVQVLDCNLGNKMDLIPTIKNVLTKFKPNIIGLSMMFDNSYKYIPIISDAIKEYNEELLIILGGSAATSSYTQILNEQNDIDGICYYEGEIPLLEILISDNMLDSLENGASWITKKSLRAGKYPQKTLIIDLDEVINIDYSFVDSTNYSMGEGFSPFADKTKKRKQFFLVSSRGCPYHCSFCIHTADDDKSMRYASVEVIIKHLKSLVSKYDMNTLTIYDDQLLINKERAKLLFKELAQFKFRIECPNGLMVAFMDEELIRLMREAGVDTACLAIESGAPYVLNKIIRKPLNLDQVKPTVQNLRKYGFWIHGFFVTGMPGETNEHRDETVRFIKEVGLDWSAFSFAVPSRGSELYRICIEKGYIKENLKIDELDANEFIIETPEYSAEYIKKKGYLMNLDVNFVNNRRMKIGEYRIAVDAFRDVIARYPNHAFAYYYLSKALSALGEGLKAKDTMDKYNEILRNDDSWREYAEHFNLS